MQSIHPQLSSRRSWSFGGPTVLCAVGSAVVVVCLYFLAWWPSDFDETRFLDVRSDFTSSDSGNWFDVFWTSFYSVGHVFTLAAAILAPLFVERRGRAQFVSGLVVIGAIWQVVAVKGATLINTTAVPLAGPIVGGLVVLAAIVWSRAKNAAEA